MLADEDYKQTRAQAAEVVKILDETYPDAHCELHFSTGFELVVATVLSAQTTDERVNQVTPELFKKWPTPLDLAEADVDELEAVLRPLGMFRRRAKSLKNLSTQLIDDYEGEVPDSRTDLTRLSGVGRKTANVVLGDWFGHDEITVDTHVARVTRRLGWSSAKDPLKIEKELWQLLPGARWTKLGHQLIFHGRRVCFARNPACGECPLAALCPSAFEV